MIIKAATVYSRKFLMVESADHITGLTGATVTVNISKGPSAAFGAAAGAVTEISSGWYQVALTSVDTGVTGDLAYHCTAASGDPTDFCDQVQGQVFTDLSLNASGFANISSSIKQNVALNGFTFLMTSGNPPAPTTGLTVTAQRSLGGAGFAACANAVTEVSNGIYAINLAASDLNASCIMLHFSAFNANDQDIAIITQP